MRPSPHPPPPPSRGGAGGTYSPVPNSVCCHAPPTLGTCRGCPSWCQEQQCRTSRCPRHDLHAEALRASHRVCMGHHCPTLFNLACGACGDGGGGGRCWWPLVARHQPALAYPHLRSTRPPPPSPLLGAGVGVREVMGGGDRGAPWRLPCRCYVRRDAAKNRRQCGERRGGGAGGWRASAPPPLPARRQLFKVQDALVQ